MRGPASKLEPYRQDIQLLREQGASYRHIARHLQVHYGLQISHNAIYSFLKTKEKTNEHGMGFLKDLPEDLQQSLLQQLIAVWTCDSTGIEGNTLTLGETMKVIELGLTISGKPLKDHEEVYGHAKAIDLMFQLLKKPKIESEDLFNLHRCVMQKSAIDSFRPIGDWKRDYNGTTGYNNGKPVYMEYARPEDTPFLMSRWIKEFNRKLDHATTPTKAVNVYTWSHLSFVRIHPFFDGNGRIARLISNLPVLRAGFPPIVLSKEKRVTYIDSLWRFETDVGVIQKTDRFLPPHPEVSSFKMFVRTEWGASISLVQEAKKMAESRNNRMA